MAGTCVQRKQHSAGAHSRCNYQGNKVKRGERRCAATHISA